jgi:hypothetical protein
VPPSLDPWIPRHHVRTRHSRTSTADPSSLWRAANEVRIRDTHTLRPLIMLRLGGRAPGPDTTFRQLFSDGIFKLLEDGERHVVAGVAGKLWKPSPDYVRFESAADYRSYAEPGTAKAALLTEVREHARGSEIVIEMRVWCIDRRAQLFFRPYWAVIGPFSRFIRGELLGAAVKRAEATR